MKKLKLIASKTILVFFALCFLLTVCFFCFFFFNTYSLDMPYLQRISKRQSSLIYDSSNRLVEEINEDKFYEIKYEELPNTLINAIISIEDLEFFEHEGYNLKRIIASFINNITPNSSRQGGSTLTQQVIKNLLLSNEISLNRKVQEIYLAYLLEQNMSKEEILEFYFNRIYFEPTIPGIKYASYRYFGKDIANLSLPETALLAGLVKSPSLYNPFKYIDRANERKNLVLKSMYENNYITYNQYQVSKNIHASSFVIEKGSLFEEDTYPFQSYLDVVYSEVSQLTNLNPFQIPLKIETYLDTSLQSYIDEIQENKYNDFVDDYQQIAISAIKNDNAEIVALSGGRNYQGKLLFNRAFNMLRQPASTIKPIFAYLLGIEYLHYNEMTTLKDEPYYYPNTNKLVQNADKSYMGNISFLEALGYSRNTVTLKVLEDVEKRIGTDMLINHLKSIDLMDEGTFAYPYAIGGMTYGISPIQLSGAYAMLANHGSYLKPSTIKSITRLDTNEVIYTRNTTTKQIVSKESADIMTSTLNRVINNNYYNIKEAKPKDIYIAGKTGTNGHSNETIIKYNYPSTADKDLWFAGYSNDYTVAVWTGFDEEDKANKTYFYKGDPRRKITKNLFKRVIEKAAIKHKQFTYSKELSKIEVIKGLDKFYLPNQLVPSNFISYAYFKKEDIPYEVLPLPIYNDIKDVTILFLNDKIVVEINDSLTEDLIYTSFFGERGYLFEITLKDQKLSFFTSSNQIEIPVVESQILSIEISESFKERHDLKGTPYLFGFL